MQPKNFLKTSDDCKVLSISFSFFRSFVFFFARYNVYELSSKLVMKFSIDRIILLWFLYKKKLFQIELFRNCVLSTGFCGIKSSPLKIKENTKSIDFGCVISSNSLLFHFKSMVQSDYTMWTLNILRLFVGNYCLSAMIWCQNKNCNFFSLSQPICEFVCEYS